MKEITYLQAINEAVNEEMERDNSIILMGEDVRVWGSALGEFAGLFDKYGPNRVLDTPISERAILGASIGSAATGMRPIANIMFCDFLAVCMPELANALTKMRYMSAGKVKMPVTIMTYSGAGISAGAEHSSCLDGLLMSIIGLKIVVPSTPRDVKGLLKSAIRDDNPTVFAYHKFLITDGLTGMVPEEDYIIPLGEADIKREGNDVTVVATGLMVHRALNAARQLEDSGLSIEIIDPRTLRPLDELTILNSVKKTGKLVIMDEEPLTGSAAGEIAAIVADKGFYYLDAPIKRVCAPDSPVPFSPNLEKLWMPDEEDLIEAVREIA